MTVYVDSARMDVPGVGICSHMVADNLKELVAVALNMGIGRGSLRVKGQALPCFFLSQSKRRYALERGHAVACTQGKMLELIHAHRNQTAAEDGASERTGPQPDGLDDAGRDGGGAGADSVPPAAVKRTPPEPDPRLQKIGPGRRCAAMNTTAPELRCRMSGVSKFKGLPYCALHLRQAVRGVIATSPDTIRDPEPESKPVWPPRRNPDPPYPDRPAPPPSPPARTLGIACPPNWVRNPQWPVALSTADIGAQQRVAQRWAHIDAHILRVPCRLITNAEDVRPFHQLHAGELR